MKYRRHGLLNNLDPSFSIPRNLKTFLNLCEIVLARYQNPVVFVLMNRVELEMPITQNPSFSDCHDPILIAFEDLVHNDEWIPTINLYPIRAFGYLAPLDLRSVGLVNFDPQSVYLVNLGPQNQGSCVFPLAVYADHPQLAYLAVCYFDRVLVG